MWSRFRVIDVWSKHHIIVSVDLDDCIDLRVTNRQFGGQHPLHDGKQVLSSVLVIRNLECKLKRRTRWGCAPTRAMFEMTDVLAGVNSISEPLKL